jgi:hypothetical protein
VVLVDVDDLEFFRLERFVEIGAPVVPGGYKRLDWTETGGVWGTDVYTDDSAMCRAALHAGGRRLQASGSDAVMHFAPMMIAQIAVTIWLGGGRMLPAPSRAVRKALWTAPTERCGLRSARSLASA